MNSYVEVLNYLYSLDPNFEKAWKHEENYNRGDEGYSTICGVLAEFSQYLIDHDDVLVLPFLGELFNFIEANAEAATDLGGSIRVCFLENLGHTIAGKKLERYMGERSFFYYDGGSFPWNT